MTLAMDDIPDPEKVVIKIKDDEESSEVDRQMASAGSLNHRPTV